MSILPSRVLGIASIACLTLLSGCAVGPNYVQPAVTTTPTYKETGPWKRAEPRDDISKGNWYTVFRDPKLNELESQAVAASQTLQAAIARVSESRALARQTESQFFPLINFDADGSRQRTSPNNGQVVAQTPGASSGPGDYHAYRHGLPSGQRWARSGDNLHLGNRHSIRS